MTRPPHPVVAALDIRSTRQDLSNATIAGVLGVTPKTVKYWRTGHASPPMGHLLTWAALTKATPEAVNLSGAVVLRGPELIDDLAGFRKSLGVTQSQVAARRRVSGTATVRSLERYAASAGLATYASHLAACGATLRLTADMSTLTEGAAA